MGILDFKKEILSMNITPFDQLLLAAGQRQDEKNYWLQKLAGIDGGSRFPYDRNRDNTHHRSTQQVTFQFPQELCTSLINLSGDSHVRLHMILTAGLNALIYNCLQSFGTEDDDSAINQSQLDVIMAVPILRPDSGSEFINTVLILNNQLTDRINFKQLLLQVRNTISEAIKYQHYPVEVLAQQLDMPYSPGHRFPLSEIALLLENIHDPQHIAHLNLSLLFSFVAVNDHISGTVSYNKDLYNESTIERLTAMLQYLLIQVAADLEKPISLLPKMSQEEKERLLYKFNDTRCDYPRDKTIHQLFEEQASQTPDAVATVSGAPNDSVSALTYSALNDRAHRLASRLRSEGAAEGTLVALMADPSLDMMTAIIAILKTGGVYFPIESSYPAARIDYMLADSGASLMLIQSQQLEKDRLSHLDLPPLIYLDDPHAFPSTSEAPAIHIGPCDLAYVMYTSGSTGRSKGVMVEHRNVVRLVKNTNYVPYTTATRLLQTGAPVFDAATFEMWGPLLNGGTLYLFPKSIILKGAELGNALATHHINTLWLSSSLFNQLAQQHSPIFKPLQYLMVGGDVLVSKNINHIREMIPHLQIINGYGPTENTSFSTTYPITQSYDTTIPIGKPINNSTAYILDKFDQPMPIGVYGELCVGGDGVARGYLNRPELTAQRFMDSAHKSDRTYKTGDLARWMPDGNIEFLGRRDGQVKLRGFRVELGEIESLLLEHSQVSEAVVIIRADKSGDKNHCAYVVPATLHKVDYETGIDELHIKEFLTRQLPAYMVPAFIITIPQIPLNVNGKVDRKALPEPDIANKDKQYSPPVTDVEIKLANIWSQVLGIQEDLIGIDQDFFQSGGHSLKAGLVVSKVHKEFELDLEIEDVFEYPTIRELAQRMTVARKNRFSSITPAGSQDYYSLSPAQKRMYLLQQFDVDNIGYNIPTMALLQGQLDSAALEGVLERLIDRHESLRTSFHKVAGDPVQKIHHTVSFQVQYGSANQDDIKPSDILSQFVQPFDLSQAPLLRVGLFPVTGGTIPQHIFIVDIHHIIADGTSIGRLFQEFMALYEGQSLAPLEIQYKDYALWRNNRLEEGDQSSQATFWKSQFAGEIPILNLHCDYPRPPMQSFDGQSVAFVLDAEKTAALKEMAETQKLTLYMVLLAATSVLLARLSGQEDIVIGTPVAGRNHADLEPVIGMFVNTLAIRTAPAGPLTVRQHLKQIKKQTMNALENQYYPFELLVEEVVHNRDTGRNPLFDVMFTLQNLDIPQLEIPNLTLVPMTNENHVAKFDLTITAVESPDQGTLHFSFDYCTRLFKGTTVKRFLSYYQVLLDAFMEDIEIPLNEINILTPDERTQLLYQFNNSGPYNPEPKLLHHLFEEQVLRTPHHNALIEVISVAADSSGHYSLTSLSYLQLNEKANQLAAYLRQGIVNVSDRVGIMSDRAYERVIGILAILKTGCAYVPINHKEPYERMCYIMDQCQAQVLLTQTHLIADDGSFEKYRCIVQYDNYQQMPVENKTLKEFDPQDRFAYVIFTSGSTGRPKGVPITHANLSPLIHWQYREHMMTTCTKVLQNLSYYFDWSVQEMFNTLTTGAAYYLAPDEILLDPEKCVAFINHNMIDTLYITPTKWQYLVDVGEAMPHFRYLFIGAEKLTFDLVKRTFQMVDQHCRVFNLYGPTEVTIVSAAFEAIADHFDHYKYLTSIPIGGPLINLNLLVLDNYLALCPIDVEGELYIAGDGVAKGYLNRPQLTDERFVANPHYSNDLPTSFRRMYKTGDRVRWTPNGGVEFLGRADFQVKIRGHRIELGEIENQILTHDSVIEAAVIDKEDASGEKLLCAYIVTADSFEVGELREYLGHKLPVYMIPALFHPLEKLPINPNGKIDRKALPEPNFETGTHYVVPRNPIEEQLVELWTQELEREPGTIGVTDNFFALGGHSLKATRLLTQISKHFQVDIPLAELFRKPTIAELAPLIAAAEPLLFHAIEPVTEQDSYELSFAQRRLWVLCQFEEDSIAYNMPGAVMFTGSFNVPVFKQAVHALILRHESLRTIFVVNEGEARQKILTDIDIQSVVKEIDIRDLQAPQKEDEAKSIFFQHAGFIFDLAQGPLIRLGVVWLQEDKWLLTYNIHHIVNDGWSQGIIINEVMTLYNAFIQNQPNPLTELKIQYKDYSSWHNQLFPENDASKIQEYWLTKFADKPNGIELPTDYPRKPVQTFNGGRVSFDIDKERTQQLEQLSHNHEATLFMTLLALIKLVLYKYSGQKDIIIGAPIAGRRHTQLNSMVGFLVNTLVYRHQINPDDTFIQLLAAMKKEALDCYENQDYPFDLLVEKLNLDRDLSQSPIFNVMLAHNNADTKDKELRMSGVEFEDFDYSDEVNLSKFDLIFFMDEWQEGVHTRIEFNSDLFERSTIERMTENFLTLVDNVIAHDTFPLSQLESLSPQQYETVTQQYNKTRYDFPTPSLHKLFEAQVEKSPDQVAVVYQGQHISYRQLNQDINRLAHYFMQHCGVKRKDVIGISMDRSIKMIIVIFAVIKSGAAYLAVDPNYPRERVLHVLADSSSDLLVIDEMRPQLFGSYPGQILNVAAHWQDFDPYPDHNPPSLNEPQDVLYVNYTSGSTGVPNGALLSHDILTNLIYWQKEKSGIDCNLRCLQFTSINFCVSFQEIMGTLTSGGKLYLIGDVHRQDIDYLMNFLSRNRIENLFLPFSYLNFLFNESSRWNQSFQHSLKHIVTAGEQLKVTAGLKRFLDLNPHLKLHNHYGSTEMHVVTSYTLDSSSAEKYPIPPAGKPVNNVKIFILDVHGYPVPVGVFGELYVLGSSEILGYFNNEALSRQKLVSIPHLTAESDGKKWYRSGDLGRWLLDGNIQLKGRKDLQVKVRGFRVEPGDIESELLAISQVSACVVVVKEDQKEQKYLAAYVVYEDIDILTIKQIITKRLPKYMIPRLIPMEKLPLMPNGKVDRALLPEPQLDELESIHPPRDAIETQLVHIWQQLLEIDAIGIRQDFFAIGGHSLIVQKLINAIDKTFAVKLSFQDVFQFPVIAELADLIRSAATTESQHPQILPIPRADFYPLSYAQKRLWFLHKADPQSTAFNLDSTLLLREAPDQTIVNKAFQHLIKRHHSFRTSFRHHEGQLVQVIHPDVPLHIETHDLSHLDPETLASSLQEYFHAEHAKLFHLDSPPLFRVSLLKARSDQYYLTLTMHHIVSDGWSIEVLKNEFSSLYEAYSSGQQPQLEPLDIQYVDYAHWHNQLLSDKESIQPVMDFWSHQSSRFQVLNLPYDRSKSKSDSKQSQGYRIVLPQVMVQQLTQVGRQHKGSLFMVLMAALNLMLGQVSGQEDILIAAPGAARQHEDLKDIVGYFVNTLVFHNHVDNNLNFTQFLEQTRENFLAVLEYQGYPMELIFEKLHVNYPPIAVFFNMSSFQFLNQGYLQDFQDTHLSLVPQSKFDLTFYVREYQNGAQIDCHYLSALFNPKSIQDLLNIFKVILEKIVQDPTLNIKEYSQFRKKRKFKRKK
jgi:tyrocidine synthetase III